MTASRHDALVRIARTLAPFFEGGEPPVRSVHMNQATREMTVWRGGMLPAQIAALDHVDGAERIKVRALSLVSSLPVLDACLVDPRHALAHGRGGLWAVRHGEGEGRAFSMLARNGEERGRVARLLEGRGSDAACLWRNPDAGDGLSAHERLVNATTEAVLGPVIMDRVRLTSSPT